MCAYCGGPGPLTKEHILPKFLYRDFPNQKLGYNARADKFMKFEAVIRDVCEQCNGGILSELDAYASRLFFDIHYERTYPRAITLRLAFDYHLLCRWLLKVSYNSARAVGEVDPLLKASIQYIMTGLHRPSLAFLGVEVLRDTPVPDELRSTMLPETRQWSHIPSRMNRVGPVVIVSPDPDNPLPMRCGRFVQVNSWLFSLCLVDPSSNRVARKRVVRMVQAHTPDIVLLSAAKPSLEIRVSRRTGLESYAVQGNLVGYQWQQYLAAAQNR
jgi:hypothetical protein